MPPSPYESSKGDEFVRQAVTELDEAQLPLLWYRLGFGCSDVLGLMDHRVLPQLRGLIKCWHRLTVGEQQDVLQRFVVVLQRIAERVSRGVPPCRPLPAAAGAPLDEDEDPSAGARAGGSAFRQNRRG